MILVTGANGTELLKLLSARGVPARAMIRSKDKAGAALPGIEAMEGDFDDPASLDRVLRGIERAFLLTNSTERAEAQQMRFVAAAKRSGVRHIVKLSQLAADEASPVRFLRYHAAVERAIRETGVDHTFLRPNLFMQALLGFALTIKAEGRFFAAIGDARVSVVDVRDNTAAAAAALTGEGHAGKTYTLTGLQALSHAEMAAVLSGALGRAVAFGGRAARSDAGGAVAHADAALAGGRADRGLRALRPRRGGGRGVRGGGRDGRGPAAVCRLCPGLRGGVLLTGPATPRKDVARSAQTGLAKRRRAARTHASTAKDSPCAFITTATPT